VEDIKAMLRYIWQTKNEFVVPVSGTGSAAWEACCANLIEPGDKILTFVNGYFGNSSLSKTLLTFVLLGERHCDMAQRFDLSFLS
jgi:alanine-glyoxylate transaminase/serine-glyoxylate transaminase/serine-pyruvate transaminase